MLLILFSLAGIPVMVGFWAKLAVLQAAFAAGYRVLVVAAVLFSLVGAYYYLRVVKLMYFDAPGDLPGTQRAAGVRLALGINAAAVLALGLLPGPLLDLCARLIG